MNRTGRNAISIGYLDTLAALNSPLHRLDPRVKLITTLAFVATVVSFDKYALSSITPLFAYPLALIAISRLPIDYLVKKLLIVAPFAVVIGSFNLFLDRQIIMHIGAVGIGGGVVSFLSILLRFSLTVLAALILVSSTGMNAVGAALSKLGVPEPFVVQLLIFNRYLLVLSEEAERMLRARTLRSFSMRPMNLKAFSVFAGQLLLRTLDRAERIYRAMCCRGFTGQMPVLERMHIGMREIAFIAGWIVFFIVVRCCNLPQLAGAILLRCAQ
jgi:cobalt/nickel transport system permease protein